MELSGLELDRSPQASTLPLRLIEDSAVLDLYAELFFDGNKQVLAAIGTEIAETGGNEMNFFQFVILTKTSMNN